MLPLLTSFLLLGVAAAQSFVCPPATTSLTSLALGTSACTSTSGPSCTQPVNATPCEFQILNSYGLDPATQFVQVVIKAGNMNAKDILTVKGACTGAAYTFGHQNSSETTFELNAAFPLSCPGNNGLDVLTVSIIPGTNSAMTFGYYVKVQNLPSIQTTTQWTIGNKAVPQFIFLDQAQAGQAWEVQVSRFVNTQTAVYTPTTSALNLLNVWVYGGFGVNKTFLGPVIDVSDLFLEAQLTFVYVYANGQPANAAIVINDDSNLEKQCPYYGAYVYAGTAEFAKLNFSQSGCFTIINSLNGTVRDLWLTDIKDIRTGNLGGYYGNGLRVLAGAPDYSLSTLLATYTASLLASPQKLTSFATTFITNDSYTQPIFSDSLADYSRLLVPHRQGYVTSPNSPQSADPSLQDFGFSLDSSSPFTFNLRTLYDMGGGSQIRVLGSNDKVLATIQNISACNSSPCSYTDTHINLQVNTANSTNQGVALSYTADMACPTGPLELQPSFGAPRTFVPANFECSYTYTWSNTDFAVLNTINVYNLSDTDVVELRGIYDTIRVSPNNTYTSPYWYWNQQSMTFPGGKITLYVKTGAKTSLSYDYILKRQPMNLAATPTNVAFPSVLSPSNDAYYIMTRDGKAGATWRFTFEDPKVNHELNVLAIAPADNYALQLTNFAVYDAADTSKCLGTLYSAFSNPKVFNATSGIVVYQSSLAYYWVGAIIINDNRNLAGCASYNAMFPYWIASGEDSIDVKIISMDATASGPTCLTVFNFYPPGNSPILISWGTTGGASPFVIAGAPTVNASQSGDRLLARFDNTSFTLPQVFNGFSRTFYLDKGTFTFAEDTNITSSKLYQATVGRRGFLNTDYYPFQSDSQWQMMQFQSSQEFELSLIIPDEKYANDSMISVAFDLNTMNFTLEFGLYKFTGKKMQVILNCPNSTGAYVSYEIGKASTTMATTTPKMSPEVSGLLAVIITSSFFLFR